MPCSMTSQRQLCTTGALTAARRYSSMSGDHDQTAGRLHGSAYPVQESKLLKPIATVAVQRA